ncbi:hypothetical protein HNR11_001473 [Nesterenkonia sandarakina]|uniref:Uncharacterized protein n=1 Tax=Nesterenkonia sandarakina TaxID=272918 RepID=A0A7Z0J3K2_9MICC|nr:hypothetical protein [Nesterenkonia sandarakina]
MSSTVSITAREDYAGPHSRLTLNPDPAAAKTLEE